MAEGHNVLISVSNDDSNLVPSLRATYEENQQVHFAETCAAFVTRTKDEMERMCSHHHKDFLGSVGELLKVRAATSELKNIVLTTRTKVEKSTEVLVEHSKAIILERVTQRNLLEARGALEQCLPVLHLYADAENEIKEGNYHRALKLLERLENAMVGSVRDYTFCIELRSRIPNLRKNMKLKVKEDLNEWLVATLAESRELGLRAVRRAETGYSFLKVLEMTRGSLPSSNEELQSLEAKSRPRHAKPSLRKRRNRKDENSSLRAEIDTATSRQLASIHTSDPAHDFDTDLTHVYRYFHINKAMAADVEYIEYYKKQRHLQSILVCSPLEYDTKWNMETICAKQACIEQIIGFFMTEHIVLNTTQNLLTRGYVDRLWTTAVHGIMEFAKSLARNVEEIDHLISTRNFLMATAVILQAYGYRTEDLVAVVSVDMRQGYSVILMRSWERRFHQILTNIQYEPLVLKAPSHHQELLVGVDIDLVNVTYPLTVPFSEALLNIFGETREFMFKSLEFVVGLDLSNTEIDDILRASTMQLMTKTLSNAYTEHVKEGKLHLSQIVQILMDLTTLYGSCAKLKSFINSVTNTAFNAQDSTEDNLEFRLTFESVTLVTRERMHQILYGKIDDSMELFEYNWLATGSPSSAPNEDLKDMFNYLNAQLSDTLSRLPKFILKGVYRSICDHIADHFFETLRAVEKFTLAGFSSFSGDIEMAVEFAKKWQMDGPLAGLDVCYRQLAQICTIVLEDDWESYVDPAVRRTKYSMLDGMTVHNFFHKFKASRSIFSSNKRQKQIAAQLKKMIDVKAGAADG